MRLLIILCFLCTPSLMAQSSRPDKITPETIIQKSDAHFSRGLDLLKQHKNEEAKKAFDEAVDEFLFSGMDVRATPALQVAYLLLVEKISRLSTLDPDQVGAYIEKLPPTPAPPAVRPSCTAAQLRAASFRGLHLGMDAKTLRDRFKSVRGLTSVSRTDAENLTRVVFYPNGTEKNGFAGIYIMDLELLDGRLASFIFEYSHEVKWGNVDELVAKIKVSANLPDAWQLPSSETRPRMGGLETLELPLYDPSGEFADYAAKSGKKIMRCEDLQIEVWLSAGQGNLKVFDRTVPETLKRRQEAAEQKKKETFKP